MDGAIFLKGKIMKCENCRFWVERMPPRATDGKRQGKCHYLPPTSTGFVPVNHDEFCSKWKGKK